MTESQVFIGEPINTTKHYGAVVATGGQDFAFDLYIHRWGARNYSYVFCGEDGEEWVSEERFKSEHDCYRASVQAVTSVAKHALRDRVA